MKTTPLTNGRLRHVFLPAVLLFLLAACAGPGRSADYRRNNPLSVGEKTVSLTIKAPLDGRPMSVNDSLNLRGFVNDYVNRGRTAVTVEINTGKDDPTGKRKIQKVLDFLTGAGLHFDEILIRKVGNGATGNNMLTLFFSANSVKVPECGNWSSDIDYNWSNLNSSNYGCSYQRNLGLNVANPGDLKRARQQSGRDPYRSDAVISGYRAGAFGTTGASATGASTATGTPPATTPATGSSSTTGGATIP